ncbi:MAG TPA: RICIN domain-containing protein [Pseudolysinimonas sp.]|nr:RICIN domain-containing protein [Pseudolysinimonas sp.]
MARRHLLRGLIAAAVVTLLGVGAGAGFAAWSGTATVTGSASAAQLAVTTTNFTSAAYTFGNETLTTTGSVSVSNTTTTTSTRVPALTLAFSRDSGASALAQKVALTVWYQASGTCTTSTSVGAGAVTGTWASFAGLSTTLAKGATATYCIRSTIADRQDVALAGGTQSFVPKVTATLSVGSFTGAATATATAGQVTRYIYPAASLSTTTWYMVKSSGQCMDVSGGGTSASGTAVISYPCKTSDTTNQEWLFTADGSTGYYDLTPRSGTSTNVRADINGATSAGAAVTVRTDGSSAGQLWQPQLVSTGVYQFVNKLTGMCLTSTATSSGAVTQAVCSGAGTQQHTLTSTGSTAPALQNLQCMDGSYSTTAGIHWTTASNGGYLAQAQRTANGTWSTVSSTSGQWADNVQVTAGTLPSGTTMINWGNGTYPVRILDGSGSVVGTSSLTVYTSAWGARYVRCT